MGRAVRMVPGDWEHPVDEKGNYIPLFYQSFHGEYAYFEDAWNRGYTRDYSDSDPVALKKKDEFDKGGYEEYAGSRPTSETYMPDWKDEERTHFQMYEDTTEGTPISPVMETPEELAQWLADNEASAFGHMAATYEQWLAAIRAGRSVACAVEADGNLISGVEANCKK